MFLWNPIASISLHMACPRYPRYPWPVPDIPPDIPDRQAFSTLFIDQCEQPQWLSISGLYMNKVVTPDMIPESGTQPNTGSISWPQSLAFWLSRRDFQSFATPQSFDAFVIDSPAFPAKHGRDPAIAIATLLTGQFDHSPN